MKRCLMRDFIRKCLYDPQEGYFCKETNIQVGKLREPLNFHEFFGYNDYVKGLYNSYPKNYFLTPSEIFKPFYGMSVGHKIKNNLNSEDKHINIIGRIIYSNF